MNKCVPCELIGERSNGEFVIKGFSCCEKHYQLWVCGIMDFNESGEPIDYDLYSDEAKENLKNL